MSTVNKIVEVFERSGWNVNQFSCEDCNNTEGMSVNVTCGGFDFEHKAQNDIMTHRFYVCLVKPEDPHQNLQDVFNVMKLNKIEIFGDDYDCGFYSTPCDIHTENFKNLIEYDRQM